ncbi:transglutaminaseTgpA domain-containing protein [Micromonospora sp. NPDC003197]
MNQLVLAVAIATAGLAAGGQIAGGYVGDLALWAIAAAAIGAALVGQVTARHRALTLPANILGLLAALFTLHRLAPAPDGLLDALLHAGARLLTSATPIPPRVDTLALPVMATWITVAISGALVRGRHPGTAVVPPVLLAFAMLALAGPRRDPGYLLTAILVAVLTVMLAASRRLAASRTLAPTQTLAPPQTLSPPQMLASTGTTRTGHPQPQVTRLGAAVLLAIVLATATGLLTPVLLRNATTSPPDLRTKVLPPVQAPNQVHPLSLLGRWQLHPEQPLLALDSNRPVALRWAVLPDFDGKSWQPAASYLAAGGDRAPRQPVVAAESVRAKIVVVGLTGGWLPVPDGLGRVSGVSIAIDEESGSVVVPGGLRAGQLYEVEAVVPAPTPAQLLTAQIPTSATFDRYRELPPGNTGPIFSLALDAAGDGLPFQQATALATWLKRNYRYDPLAPGGSGYPSVVRFLAAKPQVGGGRGTSEQFAAAYAVLARALGIPARVVVGFDSKAPKAGSTIATITAGDARAWPEIYLEPVGWIPMDVTAPRASEKPETSPAPQPTPSATASVLPQPAVPDVPTVEMEGSSESRVSWWHLALLPVPVAGALGLIALLRLRRSHRRRTGPDDLGRLRGAWAELIDAARLAGIHVKPHWTVGATVAAVSTAVASAPAPHLVTVVNRTWYAARPDTDGVPLAVTQAMDLVRGVRRNASRLRRFLWWLDPRPLWW